MSTIYNKQPLNDRKLIDKLESCGLTVFSKNDALHHLKTLGYYRLSAYFLTFMHYVNEKKAFKEGTTFENVLSVYFFDKELRLLILDAVEAIEIALRSVLTNVMSLKYGAHWYVDRKHFIQHKNFNLFLKDIDSIIERPKEEFLKHYYSHYGYPKYPPSWMIMECLSFGACSKLLMNIKALKDRKEICKIFKYHPTIIESWLSSLSHIRNLCAHHARVWNRWFTFSPKHLHANANLIKEHSFYEQAYVIVKMLNSITKEKTLNWKSKLYLLFDKYPNIPKQDMGFPLEWKKDIFWEDL